MELELRDYQVTPGCLDDWLTGWRHGIVPLRRQCGFDIVGAWLDRTSDRFVWVLSHDGEDSFDAAEQRYHSLPARTALRPEPSGFLASTRITRVVAVGRSGARRHRGPAKIAEWNGCLESVGTSCGPPTRRP